MSGDDIIFGEISVRQPERRHRPDRDRRFASMAYELPGPAELPIFIDRRAADAIERHALSDTSVELGGILLGKECIDPATGQHFVWVNRSLEAKHYANTQASFTYTHDSWQEITRERDLHFPEYDIVGWYHTHPSFGIFLSSHDLFIHQNFFAQPLQVAYVVDPINQTRGFFQWRDGGLAQVSGYFVTADRTDRLALARLVNDLENLPSPEGGGGFSPRLEAELIHMINRPAPRDAGSSIDKFQLAALFGMLGALLGVLGVAAVLWLFQLNGRIQEQNEALQSLARSVDQTTSAQRLAVDTLIEKAGVASPTEFAERYDRAAKARDDAVRQLAIQRSIADTLGSRVKALESEAAERTEDLEAAKQTIARIEKDADTAASLRVRLAAMEKDNADQKQQLDKLSPLFDTKEGKIAVGLKDELKRTTYLAYGGWACSLVLTLVLVGAYLFLKPLLESGQVHIEQPPHQIS